MLLMIEADARCAASAAPARFDGERSIGAPEIVCARESDEPADTLLNMDALAEHALLLADGKNELRFWRGGLETLTAVPSSASSDV